jgi:hypothetical protein
MRVRRAERYRALTCNGGLLFGVGCYLAPWGVRVTYRVGFLMVQALGYRLVFVGEAL